MLPDRARQRECGAPDGQPHPRRVRAGSDEERIVVGEATVDPGVGSVHRPHRVREGEADP
jgi:hypothetical protein